MPRVLYSIHSLRTRIMALTGIIFLALFILIVASILVFVTTAESEAWRARQTEAAKNASTKVADYLRQNETLLIWLDKYEFDEARANPTVLQEILIDNPVFMEIIFTDESGNLVLSDAQNQPTLANQFTIRQSDWFQAAKTGKKFYTRVQTSPQDESYTILSMPSHHGGVLAAQIHMDALWETVAQIQFGKTGSIYIINQNGQVMAHPDPQVVLSNRNILDLPIYTDIMQSPNHQWIGNNVSFNGVSVVSVSVPVENTNWIVISELPEKEAYALSRRAAIIIPVVLFLLMSFATFAFNETLKRLVIQPLELLRTGTNQVGQGNLSYRITIPHPDELGEVMAGFNAMAADLEKQHSRLQERAEELEYLVRERTADLSLANEGLKKEVKERKAAEEQVRASLQEKEMLLKEIHHRVKNNLQIISSLLNLQTSKVKETGTLRALRDSQARVRSMALIHEKLYQSNNLSKIEFGEYVQSLATDLFRSYQRGLGEVRLNIHTDKLALDLDLAVPCGLILNELMTNVFKYAFPNGRNGLVTVELRLNPDRIITLKVADDGVGLPANLEIAKANSLGLQLVNDLVEQVNGKLEIINSGGTTFLVSFRDSH